MDRSTGIGGIKKTVAHLPHIRTSALRAMLQCGPSDPTFAAGADFRGTEGNFVERIQLKAVLGQHRFKVMNARGDGSAFRPL